MNSNVLYIREPRKNILGFESPDDWTGIVEAFAISHGTLALKFWRPATPPKFVHFIAVEHLSGPITWQGADLHTGPAEELLLLAKDTQSLSSLGESFLLSKFQLFEIGMSNAAPRFRMLASNCIEIDSEFRLSVE